MFLFSVWCCNVCVSEWSVLVLLLWWVLLVYHRHLGCFCPCVFWLPSLLLLWVLCYHHHVLRCHVLLWVFVSLPLHVLQYQYRADVHILSTVSLHPAVLLWVYHWASWRLSKQLRGLQLKHCSLWQFKCCLMCWCCLPGTCWCRCWWDRCDGNFVSGRRIVAVDDHKD